MKKKDKAEKFLRDCINMMFTIAGHEVGYDDIKDRKDAWYQEWTMTHQQNKEWVEWGQKELKKIFKYPDKVAQLQMGLISLNYGLKFSDTELEF